MAGAVVMSHSHCAFEQIAIGGGGDDTTRGGAPIAETSPPTTHTHTHIMEPNLALDTIL
jgi:anti-sigma factor ChrR (cupin superfamily)